VGFLEKQTATETLTDAIRDVVNGKLFFSPDIAKRIAHSKKG
jgi:DNA-binding NarL/FixJ family response regulator